MSKSITLTLSDEAVRWAAEIASRASRPVEEMLAEWIERFVSDAPVESLPDEQVMALADLQMAGDFQEELSSLLALNSEGRLTPEKLARLDSLMRDYNLVLVRKSQALRVAVERGLMPPLGA